MDRLCRVAQPNDEELIWVESINPKDPVAIGMIKRDRYFAYNGAVFYIYPPPDGFCMAYNDGGGGFEYIEDDDYHHMPDVMYNACKMWYKNGMELSITDYINAMLGY